MRNFLKTLFVKQAPVAPTMETILGDLTAKVSELRDYANAQQKKANTLVNEAELLMSEARDSDYKAAKAYTVANNFDALLGN